MTQPIPHWPGLMKRNLAAKYCDMSVAEFEREVGDRLPLPVTIGGCDRWAKAQLDKAIATITGDTATDWRKGSPLYSDRAA